MLNKNAADKNPLGQKPTEQLPLRTRPYNPMWTKTHSDKSPLAYIHYTVYKEINQVKGYILYSYILLKRTIVC